MNDAYKNLSALRRMFEDGVSLAALFNVERLRSNSHNSERITSGNVQEGRVSAYGLHPYTLEEKLQALKRMIAAGKVALSDKISMDTIRYEMKKSENDGLGISEMVMKLTEKRLLRLVKAPVVTMKPRLLTLQM